MRNITLEELLTDDGFLAWYYKTNEQQVSKWNEWIAASEHNRLLADEAVEWLANLVAAGELEISKENDFSPKQIDSLFSRITQTIDSRAIDHRKNIVQPYTTRTNRINHPLMFRNYIKIAFRNLLKHRRLSFINIFGLSLGMAVTLLIGLWVWDELSYNKYYQHYDRIAMGLQRYTAKGEIGVGSSIPIPLGEALRKSYGSDFTHVVLSSNGQHNLSVGDKKFSQQGSFMGTDAPDMLSLKMLTGTRAGLQQPYSILLSATLAKALFGEREPLDQLVKIDNRVTVKVTGVYEDMPHNTEFRDVSFITPWDLMTTEWKWVKDNKDNWDFDAFQLLVQLAPNADLDKVSDKIKNVIKQQNPAIAETAGELFLFPMSRWHLFAEFKNGVSVNGQIEYVWLFSAIGVFVLLLACINFMNLSTARSEKRAKEVGIRKAIGSLRAQLIFQFFSESILMAVFAFILSLLITQLAIPAFNAIADKQVSVLWTNPWFWLAGIGFVLVIGLVAGSYPAIYLSSFQPVKVLKGHFRAGRFASIPRKVLVVLQFTVSVILITGTVIVYRQIQFAKNRPVGYDRNGLLSIQMTTPDIYKNYEVARSELINTGAAIEVAQSQGPLTDVWSGSGDFEWKGKAPDLHPGFATIGATIGYGKTIGWQVKKGRDFSKDFSTDSTSLILNEAAVRYMGFKEPVGEIVRWNKKDYKVVGVVKDILMSSPYAKIQQTIFYVLNEPGNFVNIKINPNASTGEALNRIRGIFQKYNPAAPFAYKFASEEFAKKFGDEERIGKLAAIFATLAILISCLGLFGLASYMAEQRTKEIGIRKVLGASVFNLWRMLSRDFVVLVLLSCCIAVPVAWYYLDRWLLKYNYRIHISWEIFLFVGAGALFIALSTVSYQAIRAALANPVKSLRTD